jgi:hypothetical protein
MTLTPMDLYVFGDRVGNAVAAIWVVSEVQERAALAHKFQNLALLFVNDVPPHEADRPAVFIEVMEVYARVEQLVDASGLLLGVLPAGLLLRGGWGSV